jgi:hypothetical protein
VKDVLANNGLEAFTNPIGRFIARGEKTIVVRNS